MMYPAANTTTPPPAINSIDLDQSDFSRTCFIMKSRAVSSDIAPHKSEATNNIGATRNLILRSSSIDTPPWRDAMTKISGTIGQDHTASDRGRLSGRSSAPHASRACPPGSLRLPCILRPSAHGAISDSSAETVVVVTSANCCFSDSALRHHLAAVAAPRSLFRS